MMRYDDGRPFPACLPACMAAADAVAAPRYTFGARILASGKCSRGGDLDTAVGKALYALSSGDRVPASQLDRPQGWGERVHVGNGDTP